MSISFSHIVGVGVRCYLQNFLSMLRAEECTTFINCFTSIQLKKEWAGKCGIHEEETKSKRHGAHLFLRWNRLEQETGAPAKAKSSGNSYKYWPQIYFEPVRGWAAESGSHQGRRRRSF